MASMGQRGQALSALEEGCMARHNVQGGLQVVHTLEVVRGQDLRAPTIEALYQHVGR